MPRYKLTIEYDGGPFNGWQSQADGGAVQDAINRAIKAYCREEATLFAAGRTDAGVHALGQVAHVDLARGDRADKVRDAINYHLKPHPVAVVDAEIVPEDFHARFGATRRHYLYRIVNRRAPLTLDRGQAWSVSVPLDADAMHHAAQVLVGHHDFTTFRSVQCQARSPLRTMDVVRVARYGEEVEITCQARSFLHNQVRSIVGTLKMVGEGKWTKRDVERALKAADRSKCGPVAPPDGLYLTGVDYGDA
ncbi:MAG: tRNA pseudouridine(38-40) synthase TruA [Alphaproteobacteria bacterium]|jgi:tRNA pseudouridine38-40 synthase|nr:tRNA pseudouridine(38-40) synthase TruA [Alphaproteobacteria bacterium]MBO6627571.1 tRNA pseudouridine(38-40) synthase TruA [Alphaproteobacteria bacterium]MDF1627812.1 tRNA pseudouridine(38-40) synthase TruA [Parvibaculaceae bacterium]